MDTIFDNFKPEKVVNLAAQAGVRYSLENPQGIYSNERNGVHECFRAM